MSEMSDFNQQVIDEFRANDGKVASFGSAPVALLHLKGAKTGEPRLTPVVAFPLDGHLYVVASKAGAPDNPAWYHNILAHPHFEIEIGADRYEVDAVAVEGAERDALYAKVVEAMPGFGEYQEKTTRVIPILELKRV